MEKCIVCKANLSKEEDLCYTCFSFFEWKYKNSFPAWLKEIKEYYSSAKTKRSNKAGRLL